MVLSLLAFAAAMQAAAPPAASAPPAAPAAPLAKLSDLPNIAVTYYDVSGQTVRQIQESMQDNAPRDPASGQIVSSRASWTVDTGAAWQKTGDQCRITSAKIVFHPSAVMPRLVADRKTPPDAVAKWNGFVAQLEAKQAGQLLAAYNRLGEVRSAILASSCDNWQAAANAAVDKVRAEVAGH
jgi:predicted secreted Zn-dependent protease